MLKLNGFPVSNYYNLVKAALLEKGLPFEEVLVYTGPNPTYTEHSPMGKVPFLTTEQGSFSESQVMLDYIEEVCPQPNLYPTDAFARAKVRELLRTLELYLELPARRLYPEAFFGGSVSDETKAEVKAALHKGLAALRQLAKFDPYIAGADFGVADLAAAIHLPLVAQASKRIYGEDLLAGLEGVKEYLARINARESMQRVLADYKAGLAAYQKAKASA